MTLKVFRLFGPLALVALAACAEHSHQSPPSSPQAGFRPNVPPASSDSPYTGYWIAERAMKDYQNAKGDPLALCRSVERDPVSHGANFSQHPKWRGQVHPLAWRIQASGDAYQWLPSDVDQNLAQTSDYFGWIRNDGFVSLGNDRSFMMAATQDTFSTEAKRSQTATLVLNDDSHIHMWQHGAQGKFRDMVKTDPNELRSYALAVQRCFDNGGIDNVSEQNEVVEPVVTPAPPRARRTVRRTQSHKVAPVNPAPVVREDQNVRPDGNIDYDEN